MAAFPLIALYEDDGVCSESVGHMRHMIQSFLPPNTLLSLRADMFSCLTKNDAIKILIMPGGRDQYYAERLRGKNKIIQDFVEKGGIYLGICAGAYYACQRIIFDTGGALIDEERELGFFPGIAKGPEIAPYVHRSRSGIRATPIVSQVSDLPDAVLYYNGGGCFMDAAQCPGVNILARYKETNQAAMVAMNVGKGHVFLSHLHFEYSPELLEKRQKEKIPDPHLTRILPDLQKDEHNRLIWASFFFNQAGLDLCSP